MAKKSYNPADDSSPGHRTADPGKLMLVMAAKRHPATRAVKLGCPCGCGEWPKGSKALFAMGHDARLRGKLVRAHLAGVDVQYVVDGKRMPALAAEQVAARYGWEPYLREAETRREGKNREVLRRALAAPDGKLVTVGRAAETGGQVMAAYKSKQPGFLDLEYVTRSGEVERRTVHQRNAPAVAQEEAA